MKHKFSLLLAAFSMALVLAAQQAHSDQGSAARKEFIAALEINDGEKMFSVVEKNKDAIPAEVKALIEEARNAKEDKKGLFHAAELMARYYMDITGDNSLLVEARKADFDSKLTPAVRPAASGGVHTVEFPKAESADRYVFKPDNLVIKKGETVRWVNRDSTAHVFSSMPFIGKKGLKSPSVEPGKSWEFKFEEAGEYFYICFIHRGMVGKVTVEESPSEGAKNPGTDPLKPSGETESIRLEILDK